MRKKILGLALALGVLAVSAQQTDCTQRIREMAAESEQILPIDIGGLASIKSMKWDEEATRLTFSMGFAISLDGSEAGERVSIIRPQLLSIFLRMPQMTDMLRCLADEEGSFCIELYDTDGGTLPKYTIEYSRDEILNALDGQPASKEEYDARFMQGMVESASVGLPRQLDEDTTLGSVYLEGKYMVYDLTFSDTQTGRDAMYLVKVSPAGSRAIIASDIAESGEALMLYPVAEKGYGVRYRYRLMGQDPAVDVDFTPEQLLEIIAGSL